MNTPNSAVRQDIAGPDGKTTFDGVALAEMATAVRALAIDSITSERQGHPGMPLGMADVATVLFTQFLKYHAEDPAWPDRDRLVVSNGHGSTLLYALLHLTGYPKMTIGELKSSRRLGSLAPGHPEYGHTPGVEVTTGPLGQGMANALGMAMAERMMAARFGDDLVSHYTYVFAGDGCLMEGIGQEAITLAGCLRLSKLIVLFDDNRVTIDGPTSLVTAEDHLARFRAAGWSAEAVDGHDMQAVAAAIARARGSDRPSLIACRTVIGLGIPGREGLSTAHHGALSAAEAAGARKRWGWTHAPFEIPMPIQEAWRKAGARGAADRGAWKRRLDGRNPADRKSFEDALAGRVPDAAYAALDAVRERLAAEAPTLKGTATSQHVLEALLPLMPNLIGGSADLSAPNGTQTHGHVAITPENFGGTYIYYGIREHAMAAAMNGMALHGGLIPYGGTFLAFSDYARPAIRLSAMMGLRVIYVLTHDSISIGCDGPTHQPVEHLPSLRAVPNLLVIRPADAVETAESWKVALAQEHTPTALILARERVPTLPRPPHSKPGLARGAYVFREPPSPRKVTLIATGEQVGMALEAADALAAENIPAAVVSAPCFELFRQQPEGYRQSVLGTVPRVGIEPAVEGEWSRWLGENGVFIGMHSFGTCGTAAELYENFGITPRAIAEAARRLVREESAAGPPLQKG